MTDLSTYTPSAHPRKTGARRMTDEAYNRIIPFAAFKKNHTSALPPVVSSDHLAAIKSQLQMLGNDEAGDCEAVRWANGRFVITSALTDTPHYPTQDDVWAIYKTQNPGFVPGNGPHGYGSADDQGMDTDKLCTYLVNHGGPDGVKAVAFAKVDPTNVQEVELAINTFGSVLVDIVVLDGNQDQFSAGKPWFNDGSKVDGGHAVLGAGNVLVPVNSKAAFIDIATWAAEASLSQNFWTGSVQGQALVMGVYVLVWPENLGTQQFEANVDVAALAAVYLDVTGKALVLPEPSPTPSPVPTPQPVPTPAPSGDLAAFLAIPGLANWAASRHTGMNETVAKGVQKLLEAN